MHRNQHRESQKMRKCVNMFQIKEQDKSPEIATHKMELYNLPGRIQSNYNSNAHQGQKNSVYKN